MPVLEKRSKRNVYQRRAITAKNTDASFGHKYDIKEVVNVKEPTANEAYMILRKLSDQNANNIVPKPLKYQVNHKMKLSKKKKRDKSRENQVLETKISVDDEDSVSQEKSQTNFRAAYLDFMDLLSRKSNSQETDFLYSSSDELDKELLAEIRGDELQNKTPKNIFENLNKKVLPNEMAKRSDEKTRKKQKLNSVEKISKSQNEAKLSSPQEKNIKKKKGNKSPFMENDTGSSNDFVSLTKNRKMNRLGNLRNVEYPEITKKSGEKTEKKQTLNSLNSRKNYTYQNQVELSKLQERDVKKRKGNKKPPLENDKNSSDEDLTVEEKMDKLYKFTNVEHSGVTKKSEEKASKTGKLNRHQNEVNLSKLQETGVKKKKGSKSSLIENDEDSHDEFESLTNNKKIKRLYNLRNVEHTEISEITKKTEGKTEKKRKLNSLDSKKIGTSQNQVKLSKLQERDVKMKKGNKKPAVENDEDSGDDFKGLDIDEKMDRLHKLRNVGLYAICDRCDKARYLPNVVDPLDLPTKWYCHMNPDKTHNKCSDAEHILEDKEFLIDNLYNAGSIVYAKQDRFPWWPAMVEDDPDVESYFWLEGKSMEPTHYHVTFFDSAAVSRNWVTPENLMPFKKHMTNDVLRKPANRKYKARMAASHKQAEDAIKIPLLDRLYKYGFLKRYKKGKGNIKRSKGPQKKGKLASSC